jgi:hypothetical protein
MEGNKQTTCRDECGFVQFFVGTLVLASSHFILITLVLKSNRPKSPPSHFWYYSSYDRLLLTLNFCFHTFDPNEWCM